METAAWVIGGLLVLRALRGRRKGRTVQTTTGDIEVERGASSWEGDYPAPEGERP